MMLHHFALMLRSWQSLPNLEALFKIACTLAVASAECEQSVSRLRYLKTYLRSTMTEERLNGLALLYTHRDISCDAERVVEEFAQRNPRYAITL